MNDKSMQALVEYVQDHIERGTCKCGKCIERTAEDVQPSGHTADLIFFEVCAVNDPDSKVLREMIVQNKEGVCGSVDLFDGKGHNYLELGGWIGDQGLAMMLMGLGSLLGLWKLLTPRTIFPKGFINEDLIQQLAGQGFIAVQDVHSKETEDGN